MKITVFLCLGLLSAPALSEDYLGVDAKSSVGLGYRASGEGLKGQRSFGPRFGAELSDEAEGAGANGLAAPRGLLSKGAGLSGIGSMPLWENLSLFGRLGLQQEEPRLNLGLPASGTDLTYGLGLRYQLTNDLGLRFEWQRFNGGSAFDDEVLSGGLRYSF